MERYISTKESEAIKIYVPERISESKGNIASALIDMVKQLFK